MLSHKTLVMLLGKDPSGDLDAVLPTQNPNVTFAYTKHMWVAGCREQAYNQLYRLVHSCLRPQIQQCNKEMDEQKRLLARWFSN